jgi:RNA polymerase sigma-70 factor (sigma-E family)
MPPGDFETFCRAEWPRLNRALALLVGDDGVAEELAQETMVRVSARWDKVRSLDSPGGWAHRVAVNLARSSWRRHHAARRAQERAAAVGATLAAMAARDDGSISRIELQRALAALPRKEREVVVLRFAADLSVPQVAAVLRCPEGTVKTITRRALDRLRADPALAGLRLADDETQEGSNAR